MAASKTSATAMFLLPASIFAVLALLFVYSLSRGPSTTIPSTMIGKKAPDMTLAPLVVERVRARGLDVPVIVGGIIPDLTIILDIDTQIGLSRAAARRSGEKVDRFEDEKLEFHTKLREAYREIAAANPERCALIDASDAQQIVLSDSRPLTNINTAADLQTLA